jgi:hypothetical protein
VNPDHSRSLSAVWTEQVTRRLGESRSTSAAIGPGLAESSGRHPRLNVRASCADTVRSQCPVA